MANIRILNLPLDAMPNKTDVLAVDALTTRGVTIENAVKIGRPFASQAEAEAGTDYTKAMNPLTVRQAVIAYAGAELATAAQGALADSAIQAADLSAVATSGAYDDLSGKPALGTAASTAATDYATATQGAKADAAVQPAALDAVKVPAGGTTGQVLAKTSDIDNDVGWSAVGVGDMLAAANLGDLDSLPDARVNLGVGAVVNTRTALKALNPAKDTSAYLKEPGREGQFILRGEDDLSAQMVMAEVTTINVDNAADTFAMRSITTTAFNTNGLLSCPSHGFQNGDVVALNEASVNGLVQHRAMFIVEASANNFKLASTKGGAGLTYASVTKPNVVIAQFIPFAAFTPLLVSPATADLAENTVYWTIRASRYACKLATSRENAEAGIAIDITENTNVLMRSLRDPSEAGFVVPTGRKLDGSQGAWKRQFAGGYVTPDAFGAVGDCITIQDAVATVGSTTLTSPSGPFTAAYVGKPIIIAGAKAAPVGDSDTRNRIFVTTIASVTNAKTVVLASAPDVAVTGAEASFGTDNWYALRCFWRFIQGGQVKGLITKPYATSLEMGYWSGTDCTWTPTGDLVWIGDTVFNGGFLVNQAALSIKADETDTVGVVMYNVRVNCSLMPNMNGFCGAYFKDVKVFGTDVRNVATGNSGGTGPVSYGGGGIAFDGGDGLIIRGGRVTNCASAVKTGGNNGSEVRDMDIDVFAKDCATLWQINFKDAILPDSPKQLNAKVSIRGHNCGLTGGNVVNQNGGLIIADRPLYPMRGDISVANDPGYGAITVWKGLRSYGGIYKFDISGDVKNYVNISQNDADMIPGSVSANATEDMFLEITHTVGDLTGAMVTGTNAGASAWAGAPNRSLISIVTKTYNSAITGGDISAVTNLYIDVRSPTIGGRGIVGLTAAEISAAGNTVFLAQMQAKTGWGVPTGTLARTTFAVKAAGDLPISPTYSDAQMSALRSEIITIEQRLAALITDLGNKQLRILSA